MKAACLLFVCLSVLSLVKAQAQQRETGIAPSMPSMSAASYYYISKPGELTMQVNIWGYVKNPGRYEIPTFTDLIQLVSFAGGPSPEGNLGDVKVTTVVMQDTVMSMREYSVKLNDLQKIDKEKLVLHPGDTIYIDRTGWSSFRDLLTVVSATLLTATTVAGVLITIHNSK
jgi:hypothetical protein